MGARVTYLNHSGFLVEHGGTALVFDCIGPFDSPALLRALAEARVIALASHFHGDHFDKRILDWGCPLALGKGIRKGYDAHYMKPGDAIRVGDAQVEAFGSTDSGVSFLVRLPGLTVFHAGDLNDWHWRAESTPAEVGQMHRAFTRVLDALPESGIDIAMFPVDPRMGEGHDEGARQFMRRCHPRVFFPMHFWDRPDAALQFARESFPGVTVVALTESGQSYDAREV